MKKTAKTYLEDAKKISLYVDAVTLETTMEKQGKEYVEESQSQFETNISFCKNGPQQQSDSLDCEITCWI